MAVRTVTETLNQCTLERKSPLKSDEAALKIQRIYRGHLGRIEAKKVERDFLSKAKPYEEKQVALLRQDELICKELVCSHLVPLKIRVYRNFMIITKPPKNHLDTKEYMGFYVDHQTELTEAVKELVAFFCVLTLHKVSIRSNLTGSVRWCRFSLFAKGALPIVGPLPLYLEEGKGKIGLNCVTSEFSRDLKNTEPQYFEVCQNAICLFPYHFEEIFSTVKIYDPNIEQSREHLQQMRDTALEDFKLIYGDHLAFIKKNGITLQNPLEIAQVTPDRIEVLKKAVALAIQTAHKNERSKHDFCDWKNCLGEDPEGAIKLFEAAFPKVMDLTRTFLSEALKGLIAPDKDISFNQLLGRRTLWFSLANSSIGQSYSDLTKQIASELPMLSLKESEKHLFVDNIVLFSMFTEMQRHEIALYRSFNRRSLDAVQCIFC